jgi:hypothetical protein
LANLTRAEGGRLVRRLVRRSCAAAHELAEWDAEGRRERRHDASVHRFAGLEALDRAREDVGGFRKVVDAVAARHPEAEDAR